MSSKKLIPIAVDCDTGIDDAWSIISLLKNEENFNLKLLGITLVNGNTSLYNSIQNSLLILKTFNRLDVPIFAGAESAIISKNGFYSYFHGRDGFADVYTDKPSKDLVQKKHAVEALKDMIEENPHEIVIFALGPLTNLALLYKIHPEISSKIKTLWIMGGNFKGIGNITSSAEFNFWSDPEAVSIVLTESKCPIYILPWEVCVEAAKATPMQTWRMEVLSNSSDVTNLMDPVDQVFRVRGNFTPCDAYTIGCFLHPEMITVMKECFVSVELSGQLTRGQMVTDRKEIDKKNAL